MLSPWLRQLSSPICMCQPCVGYWSVHYVLWEQSSSHVASFACSGSLFQMWMCCKGGHYRGFFVYAHYRSAQTSFIGAWGGGSNKMRCRCLTFYPTLQIFLPRFTAHAHINIILFFSCWQYLMYLHYCKGRFRVGVDVNKTQSNR